MVVIALPLTYFVSLISVHYTPGPDFFDKNHSMYTHEAEEYTVFR